MARIPQTSIEQWSVLRVIIETGSFAQAAKELHRSQSAVSYSVARLQDRLGIQLLQIDGRKAQLTEMGRTLLAGATPLIDDLMRLEERARYLASGGEAHIRLLADSIFPKRLLFAALSTFDASYPHVQVELREMIRQVAPDPLKSPFDLAVSVWTLDQPGAQRIFDVRLIAVTRAGHPLASRKMPTQATLDRYRKVTIGDALHDTTPASTVQSQGLVWHVNTVDAAIEAVTSGLCYGWLPHHLIEDALISGRLVELNLGPRAQRLVPLALSYADEDRAGGATRALAAILLAQAAIGS
ncbi:LysR family transcriptional regulator [Paraburkholderia domus]|uniref:LysR family transcriptional regulator n=1 Tax=Paraburkholderia domus TaxID=2793075 RepID=UPI001912AAA2|nr:LysR family transcriptional regulator [Paraburkholderia domus]MBK5052287.1 LysR family transcriptional regulator [Burkholderia sp. R-70006]MBK5182122.1 LysR family transcriptional regulator [Burkholderia sp. R-69749]MCI0150056.1 LysR family transcriptional regulator [Paraburkholderia sediminicola]CAE6806145.1 HTH-type transcriptional regulator YhaJ [Paraburkholderia domus]CAE6841243.1 HTH-type transcriptional regulator YhaJ [Paraburkholderia domus]